MPAKSSRTKKQKPVTNQRREVILSAHVFSRPEWKSTTDKAKRLQINTRRAVTAIREVVEIIQLLPISERQELLADVDQLQSASALLAQVARIFEHCKENSERAVKRADAERAAQRNADVERLIKEMFGTSPAPEQVQAYARDLLLFDTRGVAEEYAKSKGFQTGFISVNQVWEIRHALNGPVARLAKLLATERLDMHKRGIGFIDNDGLRNVSFGWMDFEDWRAQKNGGTSPPQVTASKGTA